MTEPKRTAVSGGGFLIANATPDDVVTPEDFIDEQTAFRGAVAEFMAREIAPNAKAIEKAIKRDYTFLLRLVEKAAEEKRSAADVLKEMKAAEHDYLLLRRLMAKAGQEGLLAVEVPEAYGGLGMDLLTSALVFEGVGACPSMSFSVTVGAHTGIGTWPILYFGSEAQRRKYLPRFASGEAVAAYALTEPGSGSDALAAKCRAELSPDGTHWIVNGEKRFITNAGFADVFTVFVKINGQNACLIVERGTPGLSIGKEEDKVGIRGSSTCSLIFEDARVPAENLLGEIGKGHKIVLNTLNLGRFKLGAAVLGGIKSAIAESVRYANDRKQFGKRLAELDAVQAKIADMVVNAWVGESMVYRTAGLLAQNLEGIETGLPPEASAKGGEAAIKAIEEYTAECSIVKVALSEYLDAAVDEAVQIHGGYGFIEEYPVARAYRDSRINRIFEGTNEINRLVIIGALTKRAMKGELELFEAIAKVETIAVPAFGFSALRDRLESVKKATLFVLGQAINRFGTALEEEQQILLGLADMVIIVYAMESALLRLEKLAVAGGTPELEQAVVKAYYSDSVFAIVKCCWNVLAACYDETERDAKVSRAAGLLAAVPEDAVALRRVIAAAAIAKNGYPF